MTSTVAGISRTVSPNREALSATTLLLSGVAVTSPRPATGAGAGTGVAVRVRARPATRVAARLRCVPDSVRRTGLRCGGETTMGPRLSGFLSACAITGAAGLEANRATTPSGATDEHNQR